MWDHSVLTKKRDRLLMLWRKSLEAPRHIKRSCPQSRMLLTVAHEGLWRFLE